ncbi:GNAT family N-acetyltransferase [Candidatus Omnitrophota bacterium]
MKEFKGLYFVGKAVNLRELQREDSSQIVAWRNNPELGKYLCREKMSVEQQNRFFDQYQQKDNDYYFIAETKREGTPVGSVAIFDVDYSSKNAELGRLLVCEGYRNLSFEAVFLSLHFAFEELGLHKIYCQVQRRNKKALTFFTSLGFHQEGLFTQHYFDGEKFLDIVFLSMFKTDYSKVKQGFMASTV